MLARLRADRRARGDRRAAFAAWAAQQPGWRRALALAAAGVLAAGAFAAFFVVFGAGDLNAHGHPAPAPLGARVLRAALETVGGGACAGLAYAAAAPWLLDVRRRRRWAAGAAVGVAWALGLLARPVDRPPTLGWDMIALAVLLNALLGVALAVPPGWAAEQARAGARVA